MHFKQVERKVRLMRDSGQSSGHCSLLLPCHVLSQGCPAQSGELCPPPLHPIKEHCLRKPGTVRSAESSLWRNIV